MVENGAQLVEGFLREAYEAEHLPRAITIPLQQLERQTMAAITPAAKAGYTHVWVHQIGPDQAGFFQFYAQEVLPKFRKCWEE